MVPDSQSMSLGVPSMDHSRVQLCHSSRGDQVVVNGAILWGSTDNYKAMCAIVQASCVK